MKSLPKMPQRAMVRIWLTSLHQKSSTHERALSFLFYILLERALRVDSNSCGAVAEDSAKTAPVQQRRPLPVAETGRSCWGRGQQDASGREADAGSRNPGSLSYARLATSTRAHQKAQRMNVRKRGRMAAEKEKSTSILNESTCHFGRSSGI